jgi:hypothetical protein
MKNTYISFARRRENKYGYRSTRYASKGPTI